MEPVRGLNLFLIKLKTVESNRLMKMNLLKRSIGQGELLQCNTWKLLNKNQQCLHSIFFIQPFKNNFAAMVQDALRKQTGICYNGEIYEAATKTPEVIIKRNSVVADLVNGQHQVMVSSGESQDRVDTIVVLDQYNLPYTVDCSHIQIHWKQKLLAQIQLQINQQM